MSEVSLSHHPIRIAYFVTPHGFGHAARSAAVMSALQARNPAIRFNIITQVPDWFFRDSISDSFDYHDVYTDLGLVQTSALEADLSATLNHLATFLPFNDARIATLADQIGEQGCDLVLCDIAPMGIAVAKALGIPSVLIENFTWDWIYESYADAYPAIRPHIRYLHDLFNAADYHIQTQPICAAQSVDLATNPVYRNSRTSAAVTRARLGLAPETRVVMLTMGGIPGNYPFIKQLTEHEDLTFIIPGGAAEQQQQRNVILLPHRSDFFHPDLVVASDAVVGKVGYSTVSEVYAAGIPFGYILRDDFREGPPLEAFIERNMQGLAIAQDAFNNGDWLASLPRLMALPRESRPEPNGADQIAQFVLQLLIEQRSVLDRAILPV